MANTPPETPWRVTPDGIVQSTRTLPVDEIMFGDYFEQVVAQHSERIAMVDTETGQVYTYGEVLQIGKSIGAMLQERGVKPHDLVVLCAVTGVKALCYLLALVLCQATMVATKHFYSVYELGDVLKNFPSLKLVIGDSASASKLHQATSIEVVNLEENWDLSRATDFEQPGKADPKSSVIMMCLTSGSTGPSKPVCSSHFNVMANAVLCPSDLGRYLMYHSLSLQIGSIISLMLLGKTATLCMARDNLADNLEKYLDVCSEYKVEASLAPPVLITALANYGPTDKLASFKRLFSGGSRIPQATIDKLRSLHPHIRISFTYASSETGLLVLQADDPSNINCLAVLPNVEVKVVDLDTNQTLGPKKNGELHCKAPTIALGYYSNEDATNEAFIDGWQLTGDLAYRDDNGRIVIVDRLKQMIRCMDTQVAPADLELLLSRYENVLRVVVGGVPHEKYGEAAAAFVVPRDHSNLGQFREKLLAVVRDNFAPYKHLHGGLYFVKSIPKTASGKFFRRKMIEMHLKKDLEYIE